MDGTNTNSGKPENAISKADELRSKIVAKFQEAQPLLTGYRAYAEGQRALNIEYHKARCEEAFPGVPVEETASVIVLDACQTPKSLDVAIAQMKSAGIAPKRVVHDLSKHQFLLYV